MNILILKPSSLGDIVHALPVLRLLKRHRPDASIYWWVDTRLAPLLQGDPDLAGLVPFDRHRGWSPAYWPELCRSLHGLRQIEFDWVIDLQGLARSGLIAWLANGSLSIGLEDLREGAAAFYDYTVPRPSFYTHAVDWYLQVLPHLGVSSQGSFEWIPERTAVRESIERKWSVQQELRLILLPGARWTNKAWPPGRFAALAESLARRIPELQFTVLGGDADRAAGQLIQSAAPGRTLDLTGLTTLPEMIEWIRRSTMVVTNDTGPMHVAAALQKPVLAIFGPTEPRRTGPYGQLDHVLQHSLPCVPCMKDYCTWHPPLECLDQISVQEVLQKTLDRLQTLGVRPKP